MGALAPISPFPAVPSLLPTCSPRPAMAEAPAVQIRLRQSAAFSRSFHRPN